MIEFPVSSAPRVAFLSVAEVVLAHTAQGDLVVASHRTHTTFEDLVVEEFPLFNILHASTMSSRV